ncbi:hypothetical protein ELE36_06345 [Pseudolysobacter antarcticus]|uniref:DUF4062 domain-containing protein n=2 Tax=Pseudolysobacter antarcticus TaxID=2511995 RepID=A0A411HHL7_9GAMM|nr:hypothetical protein ELE36_06345 [Pseudolysobacter antarcticus]
MPRTATIVQVFASSPSDVFPEREILENAITEVNRNVAREYGVVFELLKWETDTRPEFSQDPQEIINRQIGDGYDVFIGILWRRIGTQTPRAQSGTIEEFNRAYERFKSNSIAPEIMIYFKDTPIAPSKFDMHQMQKVQDFKHSIAAMGGLYSVFDSQDQFKVSLRTHLAALVRKFSSSTSKTLTTQIQTKPTIDNPYNEDEDELGYLDYIEIFESRTAETSLILDTITEAANLFTRQMERRTKAISELEQPIDRKAARNIMKMSAEDMNTYAKSMTEQSESISKSQSAAYDALGKSIILQQDFNNTNDTQLISLHSSLETFSTTMSNCRNSMIGFKKTFAAFPRLTTELNRAKRAVGSAQDIFIDEIDKTISTISNIMDSIDRILSQKTN